MNTATNTGLDAAKTASKNVVHKADEATIFKIPILRWLHYI